MNNDAMESRAGLSLRGGALVLKSISIFLASGRRSSKTRNSHTKLLNNASMQSALDAKCKLTPKFIEFLKKETHFSKLEIEALHRLYEQLALMERNKTNQHRSHATASGAIIRKPLFLEGLNRNVFSDLLHNTFGIVTEDILMERIFTVWDIDNANVIPLKSWFLGLSVLLKGTLSERTEFCFKVYDLNGDGFISKDEMFALLKYCLSERWRCQLVYTLNSCRNCLIKHPSQDDDPDEGVKDLVDIVLKKMDVDGDGKLSVDDFRTSIEKEPLLMQAFGVCLPSPNATETFLATFPI